MARFSRAPSSAVHWVRTLLASSPKLDVYIVASGSDEKRIDLTIALCETYPLDGARQHALARGERVLLRGKLSADDVQRIVDNVQSMGIRVELEPSNPDDPDADLPQVEDIGAFADAGREPKRTKPDDSLGSMFNLNAGLVGLDSEEDAPPTPAPRATAPATGGGIFGGSLALSDLDEPASAGPKPSAMARTPSPPRSAPPPPPRSAAPPRLPPAAAAPKPAAKPVASDPPADRFRPSGHDSSALEIAIDRPPPDPMHSQPPPREKDTFEVPRCPTHNDLKVGGRCPSCDAEEAAVRGRLFGGKMRDNPPVRVGIGVVAGVVLGWLVTTPMARRAERQVEYIREEARREHRRPLEEAQAHAAELDTKADDESQTAFMRTLAVWGLITAAVTGVWFRLT